MSLRKRPPTSDGPPAAPEQDVLAYLTANDEPEGTSTDKLCEQLKLDKAALVAIVNGLLSQKKIVVLTKGSVLMCKVKKEDTPVDDGMFESIIERTIFDIVKAENDVGAGCSLLRIKEVSKMPLTNIRKNVSILEKKHAIFCVYSQDNRTKTYYTKYVDPAMLESAGESQTSLLYDSSGEFNAAAVAVAVQRIRDMIKSGDRGKTENGFYTVDSIYKQMLLDKLLTVNEADTNRVWQIQKEHIGRVMNLLFYNFVLVRSFNKHENIYYYSYRNEHKKNFSYTGAGFLPCYGCAKIFCCNASNDEINVAGCGHMRNWLDF